MKYNLPQDEIWASVMKQANFLKWAGWILILVFVAKVAYFFWRFPQFYLFWDYLGHIQDAEIISWPWVGGWNNYYWGGYPTIAYPPLSHWLLKILGWIFANTRWQLIAFNGLSLVMFLHASFRLTKKHLTDQGLRILAFTSMVLLFTISPIDALATMRGVLVSGTIAATLGLPLFLYFLSSDDWVEQGFWLGVLLLTHTLTASMAVLYWLIEFVWLFFKKESRRMLTLKTWFYSLLLAAVIGLIWILPFLDPQIPHTSYNLNGKIYGFSWPFLILLLTQVSWQIKQKKKLSRLSIFALASGLLSMMPLWPSKMLEQTILSGIHFYRYYPLFLLITPIALLKDLPAEINLWWEKYGTGLTLGTITIASVIIATTTISPLDYSFTLYPENFPSEQARAIDSANDKEIDIFPRTAEHLWVENSSLLGSVGLFFESAPDSLVYGLVKYKLNPESFSVPIYTHYIKELSLSVSDMDQLLDWLGISYQAVVSAEPEMEDGIMFGELNISRENFEHHRYYYLQPLQDTTLVETLAERVEVQPDFDVWHWWSQPNKRLVTRNEVDLSAELNLNQPEVTHLVVSDDTISFRVEGDQLAPVLVKFSYSPYWQVEGKSTPPNWVTPGNMLLYAQGDIKLSWQTPSYMKAFGIISLLALASTGLYLVQREMMRIAQD